MTKPKTKILTVVIVTVVTVAVVTAVKVTYFSLNEAVYRATPGFAWVC